MTPAATAQQNKGQGMEKVHAGKDMREYQKELKAAKELLRKSANGSTPAYNNPYLIAYRLAEYIEQCRQQERPLTETGLCVALGIDDTTMKGYADGSKDYIPAADLPAREPTDQINKQLTNYSNILNIQDTFNYLIGNHTQNTIDLFDKNALPLSEPIKKARQLVSLEREERLAKSGKVGDIFTMKAREGWQDTTERHEHVLEIKAGNADEALRLLGYRKGE